MCPPKPVPASIRSLFEFRACLSSRRGNTLGLRGRGDDFGMLKTALVVATSFSLLLVSAYASEPGHSAGLLEA